MMIEYDEEKCEYYRGLSMNTTVTATYEKKVKKNIKIYRKLLRRHHKKAHNNNSNNGGFIYISDFCFMGFFIGDFYV